MGRGDYGDRQGWSGRGGPDGRSSRSQRILMMLRQFDANGDGVISPGEVGEARRGFFEGMVRRAGLDPSGPVSVQALTGALSQRAGSRFGGGPGGGPPPNWGQGMPGMPGAAPPQASSAEKPSDTANAQASLVPGFGGTGQTPLVPGFGPPPAAKPASASSSTSAPTSSTSSAPATSSASSTSSTSSGSTSSGSTSSGSTSGSSDRAALDSKYRKYAESLLRQYDKNKNGVLEKDEWMQMRGNWRDADTNGDGVITLDELTAKLANYSQSGSTTSSSGSSGSSAPSATSASSPGGSGSSSAGRDSAPRKSYRFLSPQERLPRGLPEWFLRKDADGDGQVTMAEYSQVWSEAMAREFAKYDLNGDGVITPEEALKAQNSK